MSFEKLKRWFKELSEISDLIIEILLKVGTIAALVKVIIDTLT